LHQAFALQKVYGLAHGDAGDAELALQLLQRGNFVADRPAAVADASAQHGGDLQIAGDAAVGVVEGERLACADGHAVVSLSSDALLVAFPAGRVQSPSRASTVPLIRFSPNSLAVS